MVFSRAIRSIICYKLTTFRRQARARLYLSDPFTGCAALSLSGALLKRGLVDWSNTFNFPQQSHIDLARPIEHLSNLPTYYHYPYTG